MSPQKFKTGGFMVKPDDVPSAFDMAAFATRSGIIFLADQRKMDILMTINTTFSDLPEIPCRIFCGCPLFMTGKTGCCKMSPLQREGTIVVLNDGVGKFFKSFYSVTL